MTEPVPIRKIGRPTKLNPQTQERIVKAISDGNYLQNACALAGISEQTFGDWRRRGENGEEPFLAFLEAVTRAEAIAEDVIISQWRDQIPQDWRAARDFLARRHPDRWGPNIDVNVSGKVGVTHEFVINNDPQTIEAGLRFLELTSSSSEIESGSNGDMGE